MFELKTLTPNAIPKALEKAERYRLLNEPAQAESICLDVLRLDPDNQAALVTLLLARTDQFDRGGVQVREAREVLPRLRDDYERTYYTGLIAERWARWLLRPGNPGAGPAAYEWFQEAMRWYEKAEVLRPPDNDDALLRWNTCVRILMRDQSLRPAQKEFTEPPLE